MARQLLIITVLTFILAASPGGAATDQDGFRVTFIGNCGFLIEVDQHKFVIDGLLPADTNSNYFFPDDSLVELAKNGLPPFDSIDVILVTHDHFDHFDAAVAAACLENNPGATLIGPPQVTQHLAATEPYPRIRSRVRTIPAPSDSVRRLQIGEFLIEALPSEHSPYTDENPVTRETFNRHANVEHLEYVVRVAGRIFYHCGDASLNDIRRYESFVIPDSTTDLAMVDWWDERPMISFRQKLIRDVIRPEWIAMMHMSPKRLPRGNPADQKQMQAEILIPDRIMQSWWCD